MMKVIPFFYFGDIHLKTSGEVNVACFTLIEDNKSIGGCGNLETPLLYCIAAGS